MRVSEDQITTAFKKANGECTVCGTKLIFEQLDCERYAGGWSYTEREGKNREVKVTILCCVCKRMLNIHNED